MSSTKSSPASTDATEEGAPDLGHRSYYINRELSWLQFNRRVLDEALDQSKPLLERAKFVSIFASNLDEFYMIRVSGLRRQLAGGVLEAPADGMTPTEQLAAIRSEVTPMLETLTTCWSEDIQPKLEEAGIRVVQHDDLRRKQRKALRRLFEAQIFPALTPLAFDPGHPFPHISNLSVNLAVVVRDPDSGELFARLKVPPTFDRLIRVPERDEEGDELVEGLDRTDALELVWLEQIVAANLDLLFPGMDVVASYPFRITRDADVEIEEDEASDLLDAMVEVVGQRHFGSAIRLEIDERMPDKIRDILMSNLEIKPYQMFASDAPLGLADVMQITTIDRPDLKDPPFLPFVPPALTSGDSIFTVLKERNILLHHPYDSFNPVVDFIRAAARDPDVLAIKQTLYRVGRNSPIVEALMEARENGKQVSAMVELKARFDEENNIAWARSLERAGVHVVYGLLGLKIHSKLALVVRREPDGIVRYVHLGTGNYNPVTARIYTDLGYFTTDEGIGADVSDLFNMLTGYSRKPGYRKLLVAPVNLKRGILSRIRREIKKHRRDGGGGYIAAKLNALVDKAIIRALYRASIAGVKVDLLVRGICCLRPGIEGVSENIRVLSIVGRFLEHSRIYYFRNGGDEEVFAGSADWMPRNLEGRVEVVFPIEEEPHKSAIRDGILQRELADNAQGRILLPDGKYERLHAAKGEEPRHSQAEFLAEPAPWHVAG